MSTVVASYTPVHRSPVLPAYSGTPASRPCRTGPATFPSSVAVKCRRPLSVTCALPEKQRPAFSISPTALLYPVPPPDVKERWDIKEEEDHVKLWFQVPGLSEEDLEITAGDDMLEIKRKGARAVYGDGEAPAADVHGVGSFHVRLLMTKEYDSGNVTAELKAGMLEIMVYKNKNRRFNRVGFGPRSPAQPTKSPVDAPTQGRTPNTSPNQTQRDSVQTTGLNQAQGDAVQKAAGPKGAQDGAGQDKNQDRPGQTKLPKEENGPR